MRITMRGNHSWCVGFYHYAVVLIIFTLFNGGFGIVVSPLERQLEKFGTRVGRKEYVSVYKEPSSSNLNGRKPKTFVLLSKLFVLPNSGELNEVLPGGPLKFRRGGYVPSSATSLPPNDQIFFPKEEDATTRKSPTYLLNKKPISSPDFFSGRKLFMVSDGRLTRYGENSNGFLDPLLLTEENLEMENKSDADELGWYTLLSVPPRPKKASEDCPNGHKRDQRGICRPIFHFNRSTPSPSPSPVLAAVVAASTVKTNTKSPDPDGIEN